VFGWGVTPSTISRMDHRSQEMTSQTSAFGLAAELISQHLAN